MIRIRPIKHRLTCYSPNKTQWIIQKWLIFRVKFFPNRTGFLKLNLASGAVLAIFQNLNSISTLFLFHPRHRFLKTENDLLFTKIAINGEKSNSVVVVIEWQCRAYDFVVFIYQFPYLSDNVPEIKVDFLHTWWGTINRVTFKVTLFMLIWNDFDLETYSELSVTPPTTIVLKPTEIEACPYRCCVRSPSLRHWLFLNSAIVLE